MATVQGHVAHTGPHAPHQGSSFPAATRSLVSGLDVTLSVRGLDVTPSQCTGWLSSLRLHWDEGLSGS